MPDNLPNVSTSQTTTSSTANTSVEKNAGATIDKTQTVNSESPVINDIQNMFNSIFTSSNIILVFWFLAAYLITYVIMGIVSSNDSGPSFIVKLIDAIVLISILLYIFFYYYNIPIDQRDNNIKNIGSSTYNILNDPNTLIYTAIFLLFYNALVFVLHIPTSGSNAPASLWVVSSIAWILFTVSAIVIFCKYVLGLSILDSPIFRDLWKTPSSNKKSSEKTINDQPDDNAQKDEVFNISNNLYTYDDARAVCSAFGARLATYDEIEDAYAKGGEWCNYGWSEGQMAFFPTQKSTWDKLQKNPKTKNNCGRPGVNGGYMENPYIKFGVNCFGQKPKPSDKDLQVMNANKNMPQAKTEDDLLMEKKISFWKENADKLLQLNSFNRNKWSEF